MARTLESVSTLLRNNKVKWFTDNQNVVHIVMVGPVPDSSIVKIGLLLANIVPISVCPFCTGCCRAAKCSQCNSPREAGLQFASTRSWQAISNSF